MVINEKERQFCIVYPICESDLKYYRGCIEKGSRLASDDRADMYAATGTGNGSEVVGDHSVADVAEADKEDCYPYYRYDPEKNDGPLLTLFPFLQRYFP